MYGALTCGACKACREGRDNLCENVGGIMGFHIDGFARDLVNMPARLVMPVPAGVALRDAACAPIAFATVSTCCSTMPGSSRAKPYWCTPAAPGSARSRSRWRRRSAAPSSPRSATTPRRKRPRRWAPITSSITAPTGSKAPCARSPPRRASTWCSSTSAPRLSTARCFASSAAAGW